METLLMRLWRRRMARHWKSNILKRKLVIARQAVGRWGLLILIQGWRDALQLQSHTRPAWPGTVLRGTIATDLAFATAIAGSHNLESFVPVVLVDEYILFGVSAGRRRRRSNRTGHDARAELRAGDESGG
jgi:hypothetical protein